MLCGRYVVDTLRLRDFHSQSSALGQIESAAGERNVGLTIFRDCRTNEHFDPCGGAELLLRAIYAMAAREDGEKFNIIHEYVVELVEADECIFGNSSFQVYPLSAVENFQAHQSDFRVEHSSNHF